MYSLHEPRFDITDEAYLLEALRSSWVSTGGPFVDRFERELAAYVGARYAVSVANGTVGLFLMLETLRRIKGIEGPCDVIVPTLSFVATHNAIVHAGGRPVFVDCSAERMNVVPQQVVDLVRSRYTFDPSKRHWRSKSGGRPLLAYMPVHLMGWASSGAELAAAGKELDLPIVEDAAEALGAFDAAGQHAGRAGLAACFSFNGNKLLTTGGGGMIVSDDAGFARRLKHLSTTAKTDGLRFVHDEVGYNFRMVNVLAAMGCAQLEKLPARLVRKRRIFALYRERLGASGIRVYEEPGGRASHWLVNAIFEDERQREIALARLLERKIEARPLWMPGHLQPALRAFVEQGESYPCATSLWQRVLSLPSSPHLSDDDINMIAGEILA